MRWAVVLVLALAGCAAQLQPGSDLVAEAEELLDQRLIEACDFSDVVLGSAAHQREIERCRDFTNAHRDEERAFEYAEFTRALYAGECDAVAARLGGSFKSYTNDLVFEAGRARQGLCMQKDLKKAAELLEQAASENPSDPVALAHLGDVLWKGGGIAEDKERAKALFARAARYALPHLIRETHFAATNDVFDRVYTWRLESVRGHFWSFSHKHLAANFAHPILGPWIFPPPLYHERLALDGVIRESEEAITSRALSEMESQSTHSQDFEAAALPLFEAHVSDLDAATTALANVVVSKPNLVRGSRTLQLFATNAKCEARRLLAVGAGNGYYPALRQLTNDATRHLGHSLPKGVFADMMANASLTRYDLLDEAGEAYRDVIMQYHNLIAHFLTYGFPVPSEAKAVGNRIVAEARQTSVPDVAHPYFYDSVFFGQRC